MAMTGGRCFRALVFALVAASAAARTNEHCESLLLHLVTDENKTMLTVRTWKLLNGGGTFSKDSIEVPEPKYNSNLKTVPSWFLHLP